MIGALIFVVFFLFFLGVTLGIPTLPIGDKIRILINISATDYSVLGFPAWLLIDAIINGVLYGFVIWLFFRLANLARATGIRRIVETYKCEIHNITFADKEEFEEHRKSTHVYITW